MKVIKKGYMKTYKTTCPTCNSDLEYKEKDTFYVTKEERGGIIKTESSFWGNDKKYVNICKHRYECIKCPMCSNLIKLSLDINSLFNGEERWERMD